MILKKWSGPGAGPKNRQIGDSAEFSAGNDKSDLCAKMVALRGKFKALAVWLFLVKLFVRGKMTIIHGNRRLCAGKWGFCAKKDNLQRTAKLAA